MGCVLCNLIQLSEEQEPFPSERDRQDFMNELASDIAQYHPELVEKATKQIEEGILDVLKSQHQALDRLFAEVIQRDDNFFPSDSGQPWEALQEGIVLIQKLSV